jgi:hypothetical protein
MSENLFSGAGSTQPIQLMLCIDTVRIYTVEAVGDSERENVYSVEQQRADLSLHRYFCAEPF